MNRTNISLSASREGNLKYHVYRAESQSEIPGDLSELSKLNAIMVIDETKIEGTALPITEVIDVAIKRVPIGDRVPYEIMTIPLKNMIHAFTVDIEHVNPDSGDTPVPKLRRISVSFDSNGEIMKVTRKEDSEEEIDVTGLDVIKITEDTVFIKETYLVNNTKVTAHYYTQVVSAVDDNIDIPDGVEFDGPVGDGLPRPSLAAVHSSKAITSATALPMISLQPSGGTDGVVYYYRVVGEDPVGNLTEVSSLFSTHISQEAALLKYTIQSSNDGSVWATEKEASHLDEYVPEGKIVGNDIPMFIENDVVADTSLMSFSNQVTLTLPNMFMKDNGRFNVRRTKQYRTMVRDTFLNESDYSLIIPAQEVIVPIEKIVIMKKLVSSLDLEEQKAPIALDDESAVVLRTLLRKNGVFYDAIDHKDVPLNIQSSIVPIAAYNDMTEFATLSVIDDDASYSEVYNYTIYAFDAYKEHTVGLPIHVVG